MIISQLKEIIKDLPDDADIIIQKNLANSKTIVASVLKYRITLLKDGHKRLVLINDKRPKKTKEYRP